MGGDLEMKNNDGKINTQNKRNNIRILQLVIRDVKSLSAILRGSKEVAHAIVIIIIWKLLKPENDSYTNLKAIAY